ncbi:MAG: alanine racemase [Clostridiales bacterium]|jgi:alanine racemase|nr:alanine racemase [Clostridiales bacterium]
MGTFRIIPDEAFGAKPIIRIRDIDAVVHNYKLFKQKADLTSTICGVVLKADVHGLQMKDVAPALYNVGVKYYFIEELCEGIELRKILPYEDAKIFAMAGLLHGEEQYFKSFNIIPCINSIEQLKRWNKFCDENGKASVVIHLDTHMNRLGLLEDQVEILSKNFMELTSKVNVEFYMSHFYDIKGTDHTQCFKQYDVLNQYLNVLPSFPVSFACTDSVILLDNETFNFGIIRPGIGLVGGAPDAKSPISVDAKHTFEIYAKISQIKNVKKGETIGYGGAYTVKRDSKLALVHIGYKDGYLRLLSETDENPKGAYMYMDGYKLPLMGKVSLGITTVDVTDVPESTFQKNKYVEVVGPNVDIKFLADIGGCYEILAALGRPNVKVTDYTLREYFNLYGN